MAGLHLAPLFQRLARRSPEAVSLIDEQGRAWRCGEFVPRLYRIANALAGLGLRRGDRVALLGDGRPYLEAEYGVLLAGLVRVPLDPRLSRAELVSQVADAGARALLADAAALHGSGAGGPGDDLPVEFRVALGAPCPGAIDLETLLQAASPLAPVAGGADDLASLNYTGGTTSRPKAVRLTHRNLTAALSNMLLARAVAPGDVFLNLRPLWPISGIIVLLHVLGGASVVLGGRFDPERFARLSAMWRPTATSLVPTQMVRLVEACGRGSVTAADLGSLRVVDVGGSAIPADVFAEALCHLGARIGVLYGLTEAPWSCYLPPAALAGGGAEGLLRSAGREVFGCELVVRGPNGVALPAGQTGEVTLRGDHVTLGYWKRPAETAAALRDGWLYTGDLGRTDEAGYLFIAGRAKDVIRCGGKTILPQEVEQALLTHPAVAEAAVVGQPDREWGEVVKAFVVLRPGAGPAAGELIEHCRGCLSSFKKPRLIEFVPELPRSHYGKVLKAELKARGNG